MSSISYLFTSLQRTLGIDQYIKTNARLKQTNLDILVKYPHKM